MAQRHIRRHAIRLCIIYMGEQYLGYVVLLVAFKPAAWWPGRNYHPYGRNPPVLDFRELSDEQLATAERIFDEFRELDLLPAYLADADPNRALLDRRVVCDLLGFDEDVYRGVRRLAQKWCAEPSVHGGKARPVSAKYVE